MKNIFLFTFFCATTVAYGATSCYDEEKLPAVSRLEVSEKEVIAYLGGSAISDDGNSAKAVSFSPVKGWQRIGARPCERCDLPKYSCGKWKGQIVLSTADVSTIPNNGHWCNTENNITSCQQKDGAVWFSISYYDGEGCGGVGGFGRKKGDAIEYRWPKELRDSSVGPILYDGGRIWAGTYHSYECTGEVAAKGLVVYDWRNNTLKTFVGGNNGPCGAIVHDLLLHDDKIWVATDLGLSIFNKKTEIWKNLAPGKAGEPAMSEVHCDALYNSVLWDLVRVPTEGYENFNSYYAMLVDSVRAIRPNQKFSEISELEVSSRPPAGR